MTKRKKIESPIANGRMYKFDRMMVESARRAREAQGKTVSISPNKGASHDKPSR